MTLKIAGLIVGMAFGFLLAWARLSDPQVFRDMLLLREAHVFLIMGSAIAVAGVGIQVVRRAAAQAFVTGEPIGWSVQLPQQRHVLGALMFGAGWSVAGTCTGTGRGHDRSRPPGRTRGRDGAARRGRRPTDARPRAHG